MQKTFIFIAKLFVFFLTVAAFGNAISAIAEMAEQVSGQSVDDPSSQVRSDSEILGWLAAINQHEIDAANEAAKKTTDAKVLDFAKLMRKDHNANLEATRRLAKRTGLTLEKTDAVKQFSQKGNEDVASLKPLDGASFGKAYIQAMVQGHEKVLAMIDNFNKNATSDEVKKHLSETRKHVAVHLDKARTVQSGLGY